MQKRDYLVNIITNIEFTNNIRKSFGIFYCEFKAVLTQDGWISNQSLLFIWAMSAEILVPHEYIKDNAFTSIIYFLSDSYFFRYPLLGGSVSTMFYTITMQLWKVLISYLILIAGFAFSFFIILHKPIGKNLKTSKLVLHYK